MKKRNKMIVAALTVAALVAASSFTAFAAETAVSSVEDMTVSEFSSNNTDTARAEHDAGHIYVGVAVTDGAVDEANSNWADKAVEEDGAFSVELNDEVTGEGFTAVRAFGDSTVNVTGELKMTDEGDGSYDSDFTGMGAAVTGASGATINVKDVNYYSEGVARSFAVVGDTTMIIEDSSLKAMGAHPFTDFNSEYVNTYNTSIMISPPWILGFQGAARTINLLLQGNSTDIAIANSDIYTGGWASLSTDGMMGIGRYYVYNSTLGAVPESEGGNYSGWEILGYDEASYGSGYALLVIGDTTANLYGTNVDGSTFAGMIMTGDITYQGIKAGETYEAAKGIDGSVFYTYTAEEDIPAVINSVFGITAQGNGNASFLDGSVVNTEGATFVYRDSNVNFKLSGAEANPKNGVLLQMMDNDNSTVGEGPIGQSFDKYFYEDAGFKKEAYETDASYIRTSDGEIDPAKTYYAEAGNNEYTPVEDPDPAGLVAYYEKTSPGSFVTLALENGEYDGDIYNGTGYYGQAPDALEVTIANDAVLTGDIALTSHVHGLLLGDRNVDDVIAAIDTANAKHGEIAEGFYSDMEDIQYVFLDANGDVTENKDEAVGIQFTQFTSVEYYLIMQVINKVNYNGGASVNVIVDGTWKPAVESLVTYLEIADGAHVYGDLVEQEDGSLYIVPSDNEIAAGTYGAKFVYVEDPNGSSGGESSDAEAAGDSAEGESDGESADSEGADAEAAEAPAEGESADSEGADAEAAESAEGESDAAAAEGESAEGESEGEAPAEGESAEGESAEGESADSEGAEAPAEAPQN